MDWIIRHKLIAATIAIQLIALPLIILVVKQRQETQTQAEKSTTLFFNPNIKGFMDGCRLDLE